MAEDSGGITQRILDSIRQYIADILARVGEWLWQQFQPVFDRIANWLDKVFNRLVVVIDNIADTLESMWNNILSWITSLYNKVVEQLESLYAAVKASISTLLDDSLTFLKQIYDRVADAITNVFDKTTSYLSKITNQVLETIIGWGNQLTSWVTDAFSFIINKFTDLYDEIKTKLTDIFNSVKTSVVEILDKSVEIIDTLKAGIEEFVDTVVNGVGSSLRELLDATAKLPEALSGLGDVFSEAMLDSFKTPLLGLPLSLLDASGDALAQGWDYSAEQTQELFDFITEPKITASKARAEWSEFFRKSLPTSKSTAALYNIGVSFFLMMRMGSGLADAYAQIALQEFGEIFPYNIPQIADAIKLKHFNIINEDDAVLFIKQSGYSSQDAKRLIKIAETTPPEGEALAWWLRGIYNDEEINESLAKRGWNTRDAEALKEASQIIPPVQDIISMAVREAFTPEIAAAFGQYEDFPEDFATWGEKLGLSREWTERYWAAHWALPSVQMGFEMLHRRLIDNDDMNLLLKAADVMPFWRDKITGISYSNFTRVDIRRMHSVGVLNESEVYEAYQDLGYNVDKAQRLTDFTLELNKSTTADDESALADLSRSAILNFYKDGLLERNEAYSMLLNIGLSDEAASLYLTSIDMDEQRQVRSDEKGLILDQAKAGLISFEQAQDKLSGLGLETRELTKALTKLIRANTQRTKIPTKSELDKMLSNEIISTSVYDDTMKLIGYSDKWIKRYRELLGV